MKHSPAPWTSDPEGELAVTIEDANGNPIADVYGSARDNPNATLMESAPDLLAMLEKLTLHTLHYASMPHAHSEAHKDAADARALIAKLTQP
jgi:hypothetical protein